MAQSTTPRARPVGRSPEFLNHQLQYIDLARVPGWIEAAAQLRQRNLRCRNTPFAQKPAWQSQGKMTMSGDMPLIMHDVINSVLGPQARAEWDDHCQQLEITSFPRWKRACELWNQAGRISSGYPWLGIAELRSPGYRRSRLHDYTHNGNVPRSAKSHRLAHASSAPRLPRKQHASTPLS